MSYDLAILGAGPAGYVAALIAAQHGLRVIVVDKQDHVGGTCLNVGCIPSKTLLHYSEVGKAWEKLQELLGKKGEKLNISDLQPIRESVIKGLQEGVSGLFKKNKIDFVDGRGKLKSPGVILCDNNSTIEAKHILLASGSKPIELPFLPFDEKVVLSSTGALSLKKSPKKLLVIGAGVIGLEMASIYARLGSQVQLIEMMDQVCPGVDKDVAKAMQKTFEAQGLQFLLKTKVLSAKVGKDVSLEVETPEGKQSLSADQVLVAVGRKPNSAGLGLEELGVKVDPRGFVEVDGQFQTAVPGVYAIGDLIEGPMLAHKAQEEAKVLVEHLAGKRSSLDYLCIPNVVYTYPELATVGLSEAEAKAMGRELLVGKFQLKGNSRARAMGEVEGMVKVLADKKTHALLGLQLFGPAASESIALGVLAISEKIKVEQLANLPFAHPTLSEAIKEAALSCLGRPIHS